MTELLHWRKASYSADQGNCVEMAKTPDGVLMRDSKRPDDGTLAFTRAEVEAFLAGVKAGEFDDLVG